MDHAKGKWLLFADADDFFVDDMYDIITTHAESDADVIYFRKQAVYSDDINRKSPRSGYIDKIMTYQNISDTYFSIVDYKTGCIDTHIETMKYGLHMQLPIYLYLIQKSNIFDSPIFTGIYYQNILFSYPTY